MSELDLAIERVVQAAREATARDIAAKIRQNCTLEWEVMQKGGDGVIYAVADWIESPPEWVNASWVSPTKSGETPDHDLIRKQDIEDKLAADDEL